MFAPALLLLVTVDDINITRGLTISGVARGGRRPVPRDAVITALLDGQLRGVKAGDTLSFEGQKRKWQEASANKDGWFEGITYVCTTVDMPEAKTMLLEAAGDSMVYVNEVPRAGDPYAYGYLRIPVNLRKGQNQLLFAVGRGQLRAKLLPVASPVEFDFGDATLPDVLITDKKPVIAGLVVRSTLDKDAVLNVKASLPTGEVALSKIPTRAMSLRKVAVSLPVPAKPAGDSLTYTLEISDKKAVLDHKTLSVRLRKPTEHFKRTFISGVDGSVQYFAVSPALKPSPSNALVLTVHGASVEAIGQAQAYKPKPWVTVVAATNRRPYGFDWEDIGRIDALEVLEQAKKMFPHDPSRVHLTGHSMGGHGTWAIGSLYPNLFASINPSAGWISFWSYAGGWDPEFGLETEKLVRRSMIGSDTLSRVKNTLAQGVYILHGDADDNVPVTEAREMKKVLEGIHHRDLGYHEEKGAGHWWGDQCVDYPGIFEMIDRRRLDANPREIDFTTPNPAITSTMGWATVRQQEQACLASHIVLRRTGSGVSGSTENVHALQLRVGAKMAIELDGQPKIESDGDVVDLVKRDGKWSIGKPGRSEKSNERNGPFKMVLSNRFCLVVGTSGNFEENSWATNRARFDAETYMVRGNGDVEIMSDVDYLKRGLRQNRNAILYGNEDTNRAWKAVCGDVSLGRGWVRVGAKQMKRAGIGGLVLAPNPKQVGSLIALVGGTDLIGMQSTDRLGLFTSGIAFPDWILFDAKQKDGILGAGFLTNDWKAGSDSAWALGE